MSDSTPRIPPTSAQIASDLDVKPTIDPAAEVEARVDFLVRYLAASRTKGLVLAVSGGQDSSLAGRLCQLAVERVREAGGDATLIAVRMPYGIQADADDADLALTFIRPDETVEFNVKAPVDALADEYARSIGRTLSDFGRGNAKARMRMVGQYAIAAERGFLVIGTDHAAEAVTGFFTKYGDGGVDATPLTGLTKSQGRQLLEHLGAPARLYEKAPTADLLDDSPGRTDEDELGLQYATIDAFLVGKEVTEDAAAALTARYQATQHKRHEPATPFDEWWQ